MSVQNHELMLLIGTDSGFIEFDVDENQLDAHRQLKDGLLMPGTEHVVLGPGQTSAYWSGNFTIQNKDEARHAGAFALRFADPKSIVRSRHY